MNIEKGKIANSILEVLALLSESENGGIKLKRDTMVLFDDIMKKNYNYEELKTRIEKFIKEE